MTSLPPDPWKALGIERDANKSEIRTAYKKLVLQCHPDKIQDPTLKALKADEFQKVQQAWELLNDDAEKAKYEQKLRLAELQRAAKVQQDVKNSPNTSVPRSSAKYSMYEMRTTEPASRYKSSPSSGKVYTYTTHTRSHEEMPSSRSYPIYEEVDKQARRTASYEKPAKRDDERRDREKDERRRRREEEAFRLQEKERERDREREREKKKEEDRERKAEKKRVEREREKEREKDRKRDAEDKARRHKPYVEHYETYVADIDLGIEEIILEDAKYVTSTSKPEKKRSSSRKHEETRDRDRERERDRERDRERERERERDKSSSRRAKSPHVNSERKHINLYESAASYLATKGTATHTSPAFWKSQTPPENSYITPHAPTPPPVDDFEEESIRQSASRAAGRRASNDPARSREKLKYEPSDGRPVPPPLSKSYTTPPPAPESPPRVSRSQTAPHESSYRPIPHLPRTQTWAPSSNSAAVYYDDIESEDDRDRRRRSRRTRSPSGQSTRYKVVDGVKTSKLEPQYSYGESPTSARRYAGEEHLGHSPSSATYSTGQFRVKQTKTFGPDDVMYAQYDQPAYYSSHGMDAYTAKA